jgi:hypothetical protein
MNNDQKDQRDLTEDVKIMPDDVNFVKPGKANPKIIDKANPKIIDPTLKETYPSEIHALKIDANHIKIDGNEYLVVHDKLITTDRREIADKLYVEGPMAGQPFQELGTAALNGDLYVNIHTEQNPNGEIRGQIQIQ